MVRVKWLIEALMIFAWGVASVQSADLRIALSAEPNSIDPHFNNLGPNNTVAAHVFEALTRFDADSTLRLALAESYRLVDATTWEFKIRKGVKFHDGSVLSADDVVWSIERPATIKNSPSSFTIYTRQIVEARVVDPLTVRLRTAASYPLMLNDLSSVFIVKRPPPGQPSDAFYSKGIPGTGPFKLVAFRRGERIDLERNADYWGEPPAWTRVELRFITSDPSRLAALLSGQVDAIENVPPADFARVSRMQNVEVFSKVSHRVIFLALDHARDDSPYVRDQQDKPLRKNPLKDLRVRKAISKAINRELIVGKIMEGLGRPTANLVPAPMFGFNGSLPVERFDPLKARQLMAEAGYPDGFRLTIHGPNDRYVNDEQIVQAIAAMLSGVLRLTTSVETMPASVFFSKATRNEFTMLLAGWGSQTGEVSSPLRSLIATVDKSKGMGTSNFGRYSNPKVDALIEEGLRTIDDRKREELFKNAVALAVSDVALIPLHHQVVTWAARKGITYVPRTDERTYAHHFIQR
jgi:peptide/nickel transport system substrate-binding protein